MQQVRKFFSAMVLLSTILTLASISVAASVPGWVEQPVTGPAVPAGTPPSEGSFLRSVSCHPDFCMAVGDLDDPSGSTAYAERYDGHSWSYLKVARPASASSVDLDGVSCPSISLCIAVGDYDTSAAEPETLAETWDGSAWSIAPTPNPTGRHWPNPVLLAVSCPSSTECAAVGSYLNTESVLQVLVERWDGAAWSIEDAPDPANPPHGSGDTLGGVSCGSTAACVAVGSVGSNASVSRVLVERWDGKTWAVERPASVAGSYTSSLEAVSCPAPNSCTAAGHFTGSDTAKASTLVEAWNGTSWAIEASPDPPGSEDSSSFFGVSCPSTAACTAVGRTQVLTGGSKTLAEAWDGKAWLIQSTPNPGGSPGLEAVSCWLATACEAVGSYPLPAKKYHVPLALGE